MSSVYSALRLRRDAGGAVNSQPADAQPRYCAPEVVTQPVEHLRMRRHGRVKLDATVRLTDPLTAKQIKPRESHQFKYIFLSTYL